MKKNRKKLIAVIFSSLSGFLGVKIRTPVTKGI